MNMIELGLDFRYTVPLFIDIISYHPIPSLQSIEDQCLFKIFSNAKSDNDKIWQFFHKASNLQFHIFHLHRIYLTSTLYVTTFSTLSISTKLGSKHHWLNEIQVCSKKGHAHFKGSWWRNLRIFLSRTIGPISTKLSTKYLRVKGTQVVTNKNLSVLEKEITFISLLTNVIV